MSCPFAPACSFGKTDTHHPDLCTTCSRSSPSLQLCSACRDPAVLYCSRDCQRLDWRIHRIQCLEGRRLIDVLSAVEVALFGTQSPEPTSDSGRLARVYLALGDAAPDPSANGSTEERVASCLGQIALPPIVEILRPDGPRWVAFAPGRCHGAFHTQGAAAAALVPVVGAKARGVSPPPGVLPLPEPGRAPPPSYLEAGAVACAIGSHVRPVSGAEVPTTPADHVALQPKSLPRDHFALMTSGLWLAVPGRTPSGAETVVQVQVQDLPRWLRRKRLASVWEAEGLALSGEVGGAKEGSAGSRKQQISLTDA